MVDRTHPHPHPHHQYGGGGGYGTNSNSNSNNESSSSYNMLFSPAASSLASTPGGGDPMNRNSMNMSMNMSMPPPSSYTPNNIINNNNNTTNNNTATTTNINNININTMQQQQQQQQELELNWDPTRVKTELVKASAILSHRCLKLAGKWAAEQVTGIPVGIANSVIPNSFRYSYGSSNGNSGNATSNHNARDVDLSFNTNDCSLDDNEEEELLYEQEQEQNNPNLSIVRELQSMTAEDWYAKSLFELGEFLHAASVLSRDTNASTNTNANANTNARGGNGTSSNNSSNTKDITQMGPPKDDLSSYGFYLRAYALYMAGERRKEEDFSELEASNSVVGNPNEGGNNSTGGGGAGKASAVTSLSASKTRAKNPYLAQLVREVSEAYNLDHNQTSTGTNTNTNTNTNTHNNNNREGTTTRADHDVNNNNNNNNNYPLLDAFGLYVYGMLLKEAQKESIPCPHPPHMVLVESLLEFPLNWSAWLDLSEVLVSGANGNGNANVNANGAAGGVVAANINMEQQVEQALQPTLATHYMYHFFCAHLMAHHHSAHEDALVLLERLYEPLPDQPLFQSPHVKTQLAVVHYHLRELEQALVWFKETAIDDPYSLDHKDVYSNILYVKEDRVGLSHLAHEAVVIDKYRPETCCIVGNYYSLKQQRHKAVRYFQRALKLDRSYTSAWTLMGHEYVELKQTEQAMESYRRAVTVSPKDYRAWYGLGQTYEFLNMYLYALFYYRRAATLRPYDPRMWCALGQCFSALHKIPDAIRAYERAVAQEDNEGIATQKLATLYRQGGRQEEAAKCYLRHLELRYMITCAAPEQHQNQQHNANAPTLDAIVQGIVLESIEAEALLFLAQYYKSHGEFDTAALLCSRLVEYPGPEKEQAKGLLRDLRSRGRRYPTRSSSSSGGGARSSRSQSHSHSRGGNNNGGMNTPGGNESLASSSNQHSPFQFSP
mmetsp:Transcript_22623/g.49203  ORF Transcript_22623/g.49203 Transcript_22623/m.49203 type:complete len:948 (+) Transcript_22623:225-3068(+)